MLWQVASRPHPQRWPPSDPTQPSVALDVPEPSMRTGHTFVALPDGRMLLFGGYDGYKPLSDLFIYSPDTGKWAPVLRGPENAARIVCAQAFDEVWPPPRSYHTATMIFDSETEWKMFVVGGKGKVDLESDVYELKISTRKTSRVGTGVSDTDVVKLKSYEMSKDGKQAKTYTAAVPRMQWKRLDFADEDGEVFHLPSDRPAARCMHSATPIDGQKVLILGGQGRVGRRLADLWEFNTMTYKWRQLHIRGWGPASGHTCVEIEPGRLLVLGGESDDGKPMGMTLYHIDYATAADVPVVEVHKGTLACGPIILADNFDAEELAVDTHGDQSAGVELRPPVIHPTFEARYFFKKEMEKRDEWSRDLSKDEVKRKHWFQQYDRSRRFLLYGGFGEDGCGLADVWELRLIFDPTRLMIVKEGDTLNLPPGSVHAIVEAVYGDRTSFLDVTKAIEAKLDVEKRALQDLTVSNFSMGIIDRNEANPEKRWRENVEQWVKDVGDQDPFPGAKKQLILKFVGPPDANKSYMWLKVPGQTRRGGACPKAAGEGALSDTAGGGNMAVGGRPCSGHEVEVGDWAPLSALDLHAKFADMGLKALDLEVQLGADSLRRGAFVRQGLNEDGSVQVLRRRRSDASGGQPAFVRRTSGHTTDRLAGTGRAASGAAGDALFVRRMSSGAASVDKAGGAGERPPALGGGSNIGIPPGRGGHTATYLTACHLGVGGLLIAGGSASGLPGPLFPLDTCSAHSSVGGGNFNSFQLLLVVCPKCGCPCADLPRRYCTEQTCAECALYCPIPYVDW